MTNDPKKGCSSLLGMMVFSLPVILYAWLIKGFALVKLWSWFVVPVFDLRPLRIPEAIGLAVLWSLATPTTASSNEEKGSEIIWRAMIGSTMKVIVSLVIGWAVHRWI